jgi:hypothetical protein
LRILGGMAEVPGAAQQRLFEEQGYVHLERFCSADRVGRIRGQVLDELARLKIWAGGKPLSKPLRALAPFQQIARLSTLVKPPALDEAWITPELLAAVAALSGRGPGRRQGSQLLVSLPLPGPWTLQGLNWHVDVAARPGGGVPGIQAFVLIDDVAPHGGATLALAGSHRSGAARELVKRGGDLPASLQGTGLSVLEMAGRAGDVYLMDMRVLHTPSLNATKHLRMMATARFLFEPR